MRDITAPTYGDYSFLGQPSREVVARDLTMLKARHDAPKTLQATIGTLKAFCVRLPPATPTTNLLGHHTDHGGRC